MPKLHVRVNGKTLGPVNPERVRRMLELGQVGNDCQVSEDGVRWVCIREHPAFAGCPVPVAPPVVKPTGKPQQPRRRVGARLLWAAIATVVMVFCGLGALAWLGGHLTPDWFDDLEVCEEVVAPEPPALVPDPGAPMDAAAVFKYAQPAVFMVHTSRSSGTAFAVGEHLLLTNRHVVEGAGEVHLAHRDWGSRVVRVEVTASERKDLALLRYAGTLRHFLPTTREVPDIGASVYAIGFPGVGIERREGKPPAPQITAGIVNHNDREIDQTSCIQTDATLNPGNSGGPLLDDRGRVVGVTTLVVTDRNSVYVAIRIDEAGREFPELILPAETPAN